MKFIDETEIEVHSGKGGNGLVHFRREKFRPKGGPDGGDGGRGGHVILEARAALTTLIDFIYRPEYRARPGRPGGTNNRHGADAPDLIVGIPIGTVVTDAATGDQIADLATPGEHFIAARGGAGGKGNARFATSTHQSPRECTPGALGEERRLRLTLKLLADIGIVGFPNAGKSTFIRRVSAARPTVADYPFTTRVPHVGVARVGDTAVVLADIPGLLPGAHRGVGLGDRFLRHVERTSVLLHLLDLSETTGRDPLDDFDALNRELGLYGTALASKPQVVAANKMDLTEAPERYACLAEALSARGVMVYPVSAATGFGVTAVLQVLAERVALVRASVGAGAEAFL